MVKMVDLACRRCRKKTPYYCVLAAVGRAGRTVLRIKQCAVCRATDVYNGQFPESKENKSEKERGRAFSAN